jgi:Ca-activated chloride channel family protein
MSRRLRLPIALGFAIGCGSYGSYGGAPPRSEYQSGERYAEIHENGFREASQDSLATFSLDVDTAAYTIMRRDVTGGALPNPDSVRIEEYVNFFDYGDGAPAPDADTPFAVHLESAPHPFESTLRLLRVGVHGAEIPASQRPAANLVFLVDVSGSMASDDKLGLVQYSLARLVDSLRDDDHIGIVVYAGTEAILLEPTALRDRGAILQAIMGLGAGGSTNGAAGIRTAYDLAAQHFREGGINRVILCTDGDFNVGATGDELLALIRRQRERGITLTVLGFGRGNINDADMEQLADQGNGSYAYIDGRNEALRVLSRDLAGTLQVIAKDVKVQVAFNPAVVARYRLVGYENRVIADRDFSNDAVDAAEIGSGDFVTAFIEYELVEGVDPAQDARQLAEVRLRYKAPDGDESALRTHAFTLSDGTASFDGASEAFRFGAAVAEYAQILRRNERSHPERIARVRAIAQATTGQSADRNELVELMGRAEQLLRAQ